MKKNSQLHFFIETELLEKLEKEAQEQEISVSKLCRHKLGENSRLNKIEEIIMNIAKNLKLNLTN